MLEPLLRDGHAYHDTQSERFATELETAADSPIPPALLAEFLHEAGHTIGEHLGDWPRARRLAEHVIERQVPAPATAMAWAQLSVIRFLAGDPAGAIAAELICVAAAEAKWTALIEAKFMLVAALVGAKRIAEAAPIYDRALALAQAMPGEAPVRSIAVASNNLALELVEAGARTRAEDALMEQAADVAYDFWRRCGSWVNEEIALYVKALVANTLGRPLEALTHADAALAIIDLNGPRPLDAALLHLACANAYAAMGDDEGGQREIALADAAAADASSPDLKLWYQEARAKTLEGFG